jgi:hypothetical protein
MSRGAELKHERVAANQAEVEKCWKEPVQGKRKLMAGEGEVTRDNFFCPDHRRMLPALTPAEVNT